jgi:CRP-like cAMP-binding protein
MAIDTDVRALGQVPLFDGFTSEQLRLIAFGTEHLTMAKGRELYREGEAADCGFVILSGSVNLVEDHNMNRRVVHTAGPGSLLGELALIASGNRPTGAIAASDTEVIRISRSLFRRVLDEYPDLAARLHVALSKRFGTFIDEVAALEKRFGD